MFFKQWKMLFMISMGVLFVAIVMATWGFPKIVEKQVQKNLQLQEGSSMFSKWKKLPIPIKFEVFIFNVTNPEEVANGAKPRVVEVGPFVYDEYREKTILGEDNTNDTIDYMLQKKFYYNVNETEVYRLSDEMELTVVHFPYLAALLTIHDMMPSLVGMVNEALQDFFGNVTEPFLRVKVKDLLFDGIFLNCVGENPALGLVCSKIRSETPPTMRPAEDGSGFYFSLFNHMNTTPTGPYSVIRGTENIFEMGTIVAYNNKTEVTKWNDPYCNMINGTDGAINPPIEGTKMPTRLYSFQPELCRSVHVTLSSREYLSDETYRYHIDESVFASKSAVPSNKCFCKKNWSTKHDGCLVMGVMSLASCQGAPVVASWPHFYLASEELLEYFAGGIQSYPFAHTSYMNIHSKTGIVIDGSQKIQFNIELRNIKGVPQLENVMTGLFPLLWIDESAHLTGPLLEELLSSATLLQYVEVTRWSFLAGSVVLFFVSAYLLASHSSVRFLARNSNSVSFIMSPGGQSQKNY